MPPMRGMLLKLLLLAMLALRVQAQFLVLDSNNAKQVAAMMNDEPCDFLLDADCGVPLNPTATPEPETPKTHEHETTAETHEAKLSNGETPNGEIPVGKPEAATPNGETQPQAESKWSLSGICSAVKKITAPYTLTWPEWMTLKHFYKEHVLPAVSKNGTMDKLMCGYTCRSIWSPGCLWSYPDGWLSLCNANNELVSHEIVEILFRLCFCAEVVLMYPRFIGNQFKWECWQSEGKAMRLFRFYVLLLPLMKVVTMWLEVWHFQDMQESNWKLAMDVGGNILSYSAGGSLAWQILLNGLKENFTKAAVAGRDRTNEKQKECEKAFIKKFLLFVLQDHEMKYFNLLAGKSWNVGDEKDQDSPPPKSSKPAARGRSPGRNASVQQFQFRVLRVLDKDGNDISQKKNSGDFNLDHKEYSKPDCYLQCRIMKEDGINAGDAFYNEIRSFWTRPDYIEATALQGFEFRYDVSTSLLDMKMPQDKKSFQGALRALGHQNGLHMKWLDQ